LAHTARGREAAGPPGGEQGYPHAGWVAPHFTHPLGAYKQDEQLAADILVLGLLWRVAATRWRDGRQDQHDEQARPSTTLGSSDWQGTTVVGSKLADEIGKRKREDGGPMLVAGSRAVVHALLDAGLVDRINLQVFPLILSSGMRVYPDRAEPIRLEVASMRELDSASCCRASACPAESAAPRVAVYRARGSLSCARSRRSGGTMEYRQLGRGGLRISPLTLGTMGFGGAGQFSDVGEIDLAGARRQVDMALDAGVNLIDTADIYSLGASEEIVGAALEGRRERVLLATKARFAMGPGPNDGGLSRHHLIEACEASLRRLRTDHIDLYQVHEWDGQTPLEETLGALDDLVRSGKVRYVGCSNFAGWHVMKALGIARQHGLPTFVSQQVYLSLQERSAEYEIVPSAIDQGLGLLIWSPLAGGWLTGKYRRGQQPPAGARHSGKWGEPPIYDEDRLYDTIDLLVEVAQARGVSAAQVALAWLLQRPGVTSVIVGARTEEQLADNLAAAELELSEEERAGLEAVSRPPLLYPFWHHRAAAGDRLSAADLSLIAQYS
jgi:aryl-alcohol dehydrogenase-like predicted oxidoreductase